MVSEHLQGDKGAPLRVFLFVISLWVIGRLLWTAWATVVSQSPPFIITDVMAAQLQNNYQPKAVELKTDQGRSNFSNYQLLEPNVLVRTLPLSRRDYTNMNYSQIANSTQVENVKMASISRLSQSTNASIKAAYATEKRSRWTSYFWLHAREDSGKILSDFGQFSQPFYGGSQAGARISYRLSGDKQKYIGLYARTSTAIAVSGQEELALGISVQPLDTSAITLNVEHRERENGQSSNAAFLVYNPNPWAIASDTRLEAYVATGYVLSTKDQYFADGYAVIQKTALETRGASLSLGGGIWAATQNDVSRVDIGPSANINVPIAGVPMRIAVDWRQRIAGNASPGSGLAVTFSSGF